jgi:MSHA biogenesis protein MshE
MIFGKTKKIGDLLIDAGKITQDQLNEALNVQKEKGGKLGDVLVALGYLTEMNFAQVLGKQLNVPFVDLREYAFKTEVVQRLPEKIARRYGAILLDTVAGGYLVGMADPSDLAAYDALIQILNCRVEVAIVLQSDLSHVCNAIYRKTEDISSFAKELKDEIQEGADKTEEIKSISANAAPVIKLLDSIFEDAMQMRASDIHIEPDEGLLRIRQRVDGILHENIIPGKEIASALILRIKLMAEMNISEKRLPQEGRFRVNVKNKNIDVRAAVMPVHYGESVVFRLMDQSKGVMKLESLGFGPAMLTKIKHIINKPTGIILLTGPTGSGKTTSLYSMLNELNTPDRKIITIEDPVEYILPRINQVQVNSAIDLSFASILRATLRHDPDVIMIGEMRDEETVKIGLRSAMTGHLVFSTLHTNDAASCAIRLIDMGAEGFLVAGALRGVLAQRLVRKICDGCIMPYSPTEQENAWIHGLTACEPSTFSFKIGKGCSRCNRSGYLGRIAVYEFLEITSELADLLRTNDTHAFMQAVRLQDGFQTLTQCIFDKASAGLTTLAEAFKITGEVS